MGGSGAGMVFKGKQGFNQAMITDRSRLAIELGGKPQPGRLVTGSIPDISCMSAF